MYHLMISFSSSLRVTYGWDLKTIFPIRSTIPCILPCKESCNLNNPIVAFSIQKIYWFPIRSNFNSQPSLQSQTGSQMGARPGASTWLDGGAGHCASQEWPNVQSHDSMPESTHALMFWSSRKSFPNLHPKLPHLLAPILREPGNLARGQYDRTGTSAGCRFPLVCIRWCAEWLKIQSVPFRSHKIPMTSWNLNKATYIADLRKALSLRWPSSRVYISQVTNLISCYVIPDVFEQEDGLK